MFHQPISFAQPAFGTMASLAALALLMGGAPARAAGSLSFDQALRLAQDRSLQLVAHGLHGDPPRITIENYHSPPNPTT